MWDGGRGADAEQLCGGGGPLQLPPSKSGLFRILSQPEHYIYLSRFKIEEMGVEKQR